MGEKKFSDSTLLDGIPQVLAQESWMQVLALVHAAEKKRGLEKMRQAQRYTRIRELPEKLLDFLALDSLLYFYRDEWSLEQKQEALENAWLAYSHAGTTFMVNRIADIFFRELDGRTGRLSEWHEYGGEPNHYRVLIDNHAPPFAQLREFLEVSDHFKRLSQKLDGVVALMTDHAKAHWGVATVQHRRETIRVQRPAALFHVGVITVERRRETITVKHR